MHAVKIKKGLFDNIAIADVAMSVLCIDTIGNEIEEFMPKNVFILLAQGYCYIKSVKIQHIITSKTHEGVYIALAVDWRITIYHIMLIQLTPDTIDIWSSIPGFR